LLVAIGVHLGLAVLGTGAVERSPLPKTPVAPQRFVTMRVVRTVPRVDGGGRGGLGTAASAVQAASEELMGHLDIPLVARKRDVAAKASAKLRRASPSSWVFEYVDGDPLLRAVLFEALRIEPNKATVQGLFAQMRTRELLVYLRFSTRLAPGAGELMQEDTRIQRGRIDIVKVLLVGPSGSGESGGGDGSALLSLSLPDSEAKRARLRDRAELDRLMLSPAYFSPIRERVP
jgi:hypothetical protein